MKGCGCMYLNDLYFEWLDYSHSPPRAIYTFAYAHEYIVLLLWQLGGDFIPTRSYTLMLQAKTSKTKMNKIKFPSWMTRGRNETVSERSEVG